MHWILWHEEEAVIYDGILYLQEYVQIYWLYVHVQVYPQLNWIMQQLLSPFASSSSLLSPSSHPRNAIHAIHRHSHTPPTQSLEAILLFGVSLMEFVALFIRWDFAIRTPTEELCVAPSSRQAGKCTVFYGYDVPLSWTRQQEKSIVVLCSNCPLYLSCEIEEAMSAN